MSTKKLAIIVAVTLGLLVALSVVWQYTVSKSYVTIKSGDTSFEIQSAQTSKIEAKGGANSNTQFNLPTGDYFVRFHKDGYISDLQHFSVRPFSAETLTARTSQAPKQQSIFLGKEVNLVVPVDQGYVYLNRVSRGIEYVSKDGIQSVSSKFDITQETYGDNKTYNAVTNIAPTPDGALITTRNGLYVMKSLSDVRRLQPYSETQNNITAAAYDNKTRSVFALGAYDKKIYRYSEITSNNKPDIYTTLPKEVNRITANGGKLVTYYDSIPTAEDGVIKAYEKSRQINPLVFDIASKQQSQPFSNSVPVTMLALSQDGSYTAVKKKFDTSLRVAPIGKGQERTIPAPDAGGMAWTRDNKLLIGREKAVWSYEPNTQQGGFKKLSDASSIVTNIATIDEKVVVTGPWSGSEIGDSKGSQASNTLQSILAQPAGYRAQYFSFSGKTTLDVTPDVLPFIQDQAEINAINNNLVQGVTNRIRSAVKDGSVTIRQQPPTMTGDYIYQTPGDEGE